MNIANVVKRIDAAINLLITERELLFHVQKNSKSRRSKANSIVMGGRCIEHPDRKADEYHHIVPYVFGGTKTVPLCSECHAKVHHDNWKGRLSHSNLIRAGIAKAKANGAKCGRETKMTEDVVNFVMSKLREGHSFRSIEKLARSGGIDISRATAIRIAKARMTDGDRP